MNKKPKTLNEESNEEPVDIEDYYGYTKKPKLNNGDKNDGEFSNLNPPPTNNLIKLQAVDKGPDPHEDCLECVDKACLDSGHER